ncbi:hypothetical protein LX36DRAFT_676422 [Colletotrichum falcatum]|nr:hypothetical protein LX36DRAFT_676422 [Colletotrichum falcatum]
MCKTEAPDDMDLTLEDYIEIITFDPDGDLYLHVALSYALKVFKKMLYGSFAESMPSDGDFIPGGLLEDLAFIREALVMEALSPYVALYRTLKEEHWYHLQPVESISQS